MGEDLLHVRRGHVIPSPKPGDGFRHGGDSQRRTGACAPKDVGAAPGGANEGYNIIDHAVAEVGFLHRVLYGGQVLPGHQGNQVVQGVAALPVQHHGGFVLRAGVAHGQPHHKPVHLAVGEQLSARRAGRVLGGDDRKGLWQGVAHPVHRDLSFLHGLQKGRLGAGSGAVQLVGEEQIAQHRTGLIAHSPGGVRHGIARHVGGQNVRGKLHAAAAQAQHAGKGQRHGGLPHAGDVLQQDMSPGKNCRQHPQQHGVLSHDHGFHLRKDLLGAARNGIVFGWHPTTSFIS